MGNLISQGTVVLIVGLAVVFSVLIILMLVTYLFGVFFKGSSEAEARKAASSPVSTGNAGIGAAPVREFRPGFDIEDGETVAVISAAISSYLGTGSGNLKIRSIRKAD